MWAFIFSILGVSSYAALFASDLPKVAQASTSIKLYAVVFDTKIQETYKIGRHTRVRMVRYDEVCFVDKTIADKLVRKDYRAKGKDKYGITYYRIKEKAESKIKPLTDSRYCHLIKKPWWKWINIGGGGGHVS